MKRSLLVLGVLCVLFSTAAFASESWVLNIPVRFIANQETGEVRLVMGLSAAPAGSQLVVNGSTTLKKASHGPARKVAATSVMRWPTDAKASFSGCTMKGSE